MGAQRLGKRNEPALGVSCSRWPTFWKLRTLPSWDSRTPTRSPDAFTRRCSRLWCPIVGCRFPLALDGAEPNARGAEHASWAGTGRGPEAHRWSCSAAKSCVPEPVSALGSEGNSSLGKRTWPLRDGTDKSGATFASDNRHLADRLDRCPGRRRWRPERQRVKCCCILQHSRGRG